MLGSTIATLPILIWLIACFATLPFYRAAKAADLHPGRAAGLPIISAAVAVGGSQVLSYALRYFLPFGVSVSVARSITAVASIFLTLGFLAFISRNWAVLDSLRDREKRRP